MSNSLDPDQARPGSKLFARIISADDTRGQRVTPFTQLLPTRVCFTNAGINNNNI